LKRQKNELLQIVIANQEKMLGLEQEKLDVLKNVVLTRSDGFLQLLADV